MFWRPLHHPLVLLIVWGHVACTVIAESLNTNEESTIDAAKLATGLSEEEIQRYALLCSATLSEDASLAKRDPALMRWVPLEGPLTNSVCSVLCLNAVTTDNWETIEELVYLVAERSDKSCVVKALGMADVDRTASLSRNDVSEFCSESVTGTSTKYNEYCLYACWLLLDSGGFQCFGTGTMSLTQFKECLFDQQAYYCRSVTK